MLLLLLLLLDVLPDVYVMHHGADAFPHRLVVQVAVGHANDRRLGKEKNKQAMENVNSCFKKKKKNEGIYIFLKNESSSSSSLITLMLAAQPCSTMKRSTPSMARRVMVYFISSDVRQ